MTTHVNGQQNYVRQIWASKVNEQFFITKNIKKVEEKWTLYDTSSGKPQQVYIVTTTFDVKKRLGKTHDPSYNDTFYWKTDSNGVNNENYDKNGEFLDRGSYYSCSYKYGRLDEAYGRKIFYDEKGRIVKTTLENTISKFYQDCYFNYIQDSIISRNVYLIDYKSGKNDTTVTSFVTNTFSMTRSKVGTKINISNTSNWIENGVDIEENWINNKKYYRVETFVK